MNDKNTTAAAPFVTKENGTLVIKCPYPHCDKHVKKMWNYKSHARTHTGQRPYFCNTCKATFRWQSSLKSHQKSHDRRKSRTSSNPSTSHHPRRLHAPLPPCHTLLYPEKNSSSPRADSADLLHPLFEQRRSYFPK